MLKFLVMKDMILNIKKNNSFRFRYDYTCIENLINRFEETDKILDEFLDLKISDI